MLSFRSRFKFYDIHVTVYVYALILRFTRYVFLTFDVHVLRYTFKVTFTSYVARVCLTFTIYVYVYVSRFTFVL